MPTARLPVAFAVFVILLPTASRAQHQGHHGAAASEPPPAAPAAGAVERPVPLYAGLGAARLAVTTYRPDAQQYFDQGLRWMHAFNLEEAEASFREALRRDPSCAMCAWGVAFALGPHINLPAVAERTVAAAAAIARAGELAAAGPTAATERERALIEAMAKRYSDPAPQHPEAQAALDGAYAEAMRRAAKRFPEDAEVRFLLAEALMDLHPWDLYAPADGAPRPWTAEIVDTITTGLRLDPEHPGLHHLHVHAVEASSTPERGERSADFLRRAMPQAAHMVHMPGHVYQRMGRYGDAALANERAVAVDGQYLPQASPNVAFYRMAYAPHNYDFLAAATGMQGRSAATLLAARSVQGGLDPAMLQQMPGFDFMLGRVAWTLLRFGRFSDVLAEPLPPDGFPYALAAAHAARGLALLRLARAAEAQAEALAMRAAIAKIPAGAAEGLNDAALLVAIPRDLLAGELAIAAGEATTGRRLLAAAVAVEDRLKYNEPSDWHFPARHVLGPTLLRLGRDAEAEAVFRADLGRNRENGWALAGLQAALERQGKAAEAAAVRARLDAAWATADLGLERLMAPPPAVAPDR
jgi:tetratricopeptide (TPR) repeat protein